MVVDLVKRTGPGLTIDLNYTLSRQEGDTYTSEQEYNGYYTAVQDFGNLSQAAHTVTSYDLANVVKGYASYDLPFGKGRRWLQGRGRVVNAIVSGWTTAALVLYYSGQPFEVSVSYLYPLWGDFYPSFNPLIRGHLDPSQFQEARNNQPVPAVFYLPPNVASNPANGQLGKGPAAIPTLRCPGAANENASLLKYFPFGSEGRYQLRFRVEFYNLFNRHTYDINGCGGNSASIGASNFGQVTGVADNPRTGQFAVRFDF